MLDDNKTSEPAAEAEGGRPAITTAGIRLSRPLILAGTFVLLVGVVFAAGFLVVENRRAGAAALRSQQTVLTLAQLMNLIQDAESNKRGYLLTGDRAHLVPFSVAVDAIDEAVDSIQALTSDNPRQQAEIPNLRLLISQRLSELDRTIALFDQGNRAAALAIVGADTSNPVMESIREMIVKMSAEANRRLQVRIDAWTANGDWLFVILFCAVILATAATIQTLLNQRRYIKTIESSRLELQAANEDLEQRVRERTAEIQEANDEIQKFAYAVSHDLRSPLVNIMGFTSELETMQSEIAALLDGTEGGRSRPPRDRSVIEAEFQESLDFIKQATAKMDRLINAVLKLARSGQRQFRYEVLDTKAIVAGIAATLRHQTEAVGAEIVVEDLPRLTCDRLAFEQIVTNLLDNAVKYLDDKRPGRIVVRGKAMRDSVRFDVEDNGRGIDQADLQRVFELFRRAGAQDKPGEGIGLAHLRALIRRLGGRIACRSVPGEGSTFSVWFPQRAP